MLYGTASMTYLQYWEGENITSKTKTEAKGTTQDSENTDDLGAFDAVSRATTKHGIFRHGFQFIMTVKGVADDGTTAAVGVKQDAVVEQKDGRATLTAKAREGRQAKWVKIADMPNSAKGSYSLQPYNLIKGASYRATIETVDYAPVSQTFEYTSVKLNKMKTVLYKN